MEPFALILALSLAYLSTAVLAVFVIVLWRSPRRAALQRDTRIGKLEADYDDLHMRVQRLAGRIGRAKREEQEAEQPAEPADDMKQRPGESGDEWKKRMRLQIAAGRGPKHH